MKALIVIDAQNDFTYGALRNEEAIKALPNIEELIGHATDNGTSIYCTQDTHFHDYLNTQEGKFLPVEHCRYKTEGWDLAIPVDNVIRVYKNTFGHEWKNELGTGASITEIVLCGFCTDICVMANFQILKALYPEVPIIVVKDACAGVTPELHDAALKVMQSCQAIIKTTSEVVND
jgi:nicotinamidase-related amidase